MMLLLVALTGIAGLCSIPRFSKAHDLQVCAEVFAKRFCPKGAIRVSDEVVYCSNRAVKLSLTAFAQHAQHPGRFVYSQVASSLLEALHGSVSSQSLIARRLEFNLDLSAKIEDLCEVVALYLQSVRALPLVALVFVPIVHCIARVKGAIRFQIFGGMDGVVFVHHVFHKHPAVATFLLPIVGKRIAHL